MTDPGILLTPFLVLVLTLTQGIGLIVFCQKVRVRDTWPAYDLLVIGLFIVSHTFVFDWTGFWQTGVLL